MAKQTHYDAREDIQNIIDRKKEYGTAASIEDEADRESAKNAAHAQAEGSYQRLIDHGYADVAKGLKESDADSVIKYMDPYGKAGKVWSREYLEQAVKGAGLNWEPEKVRWDNDTKEVYYDGINFGKADYVSSDGRSYYDPTRIDEGVAKIQKPTDPITDPFEQLRYDHDKDWGERLKKQNFTESTDAKNIMKMYEWDGNLAGSDALADSAAGNAGNADSYGGASYARAKQAYTNAAAGAIESMFRAYGEQDKDYDTSMDSASRNRQLNRNDEANNALNERVQSDAERRTYADLTGTVSNDYYNQHAYNQYLDENDRPYMDKDYAAAIDESDGKIARLEAALRDPNISEFDKKNYTDMLTTERDNRNQLIAASNRKMQLSEKAAKAGSGRSFTMDVRQAETGRQFDRTDDTNRYGIDAQKSIAQIEADAEKYGWDAQTTIAAIQAEAEKYGWDQQVVMANIEAITKKYQTDAKSNSGGIKSGDEGEEEQKASNDGGNTGGEAAVIAWLGQVGYNPSNEMVTEAVNKGLFTWDDYRNATTK